MKDNFDNDDYVDNYETYHKSRRHGVVKATAILCLTLLIGAGMFLFYSQYNDRFSIINTKEGIFVFDRKEASLNHCDGKSNNCKTILLGRTPIDAAKTVCENMVDQGRLATAGGGLVPFNGQQQYVVEQSPQGQIVVERPAANIPVATQQNMILGPAGGVPSAQIKKEMMAAQNSSTVVVPQFQVLVPTNNPAQRAVAPNNVNKQNNNPSPAPVVGGGGTFNNAPPPSMAEEEAATDNIEENNEDSGN